MTAGPELTVGVVGTAALSAFGRGTRGLAAALAGGAPLAGLPDERPLANPRARKMMSRAAYLAADALEDLLAELGDRWRDGRDAIGYYLGVGASGGTMEDVTALLAESIADGTYSPARFGDRGLAACNPLLAFQLMNNFTMCHGAILAGLGGPNSAVFSRGAGTCSALGEAVHAIASGECARAIAGGADAATHPVTQAELARDGFLARGLAPADGAALVALARVDARDADTIAIEGCAITSGRGRAIGEAIDDAIARAGVELAVVTHVVFAAWGPPARDALRSWSAARIPRAALLETTRLGETLAGSAALAWIAAVDVLRGTPGVALVLGLGIDGDASVAVFARGVA